MKKKRILFGAVDIGYRIEYYSKYIKSNLSDRLTAESFSKYVLPETHYKTQYTYICPIDKTHPYLLYTYTFFFFLFSLFRYDILHFLSGETILTRKLRPVELWIYKLLGKKVIMHFVGADIRSPLYLDWKRENLGEFLQGKKGPKLTDEAQDKLIADARKYADVILVSSADLLEIIPEATLFPVLVDLDQLPKPGKNNNKIKILFSPSSHRTKGSNYVHEVLKKIECNYKDKVELILPGKNIDHPNKYPLTRYNILKEMSEAHIVIDQMLIGWYGLKSVEALACGCDVICYIQDDLRKYQFPDSPIVVADILTLESKIRELVDKKLNDVTSDGAGKINWVLKNHTIENNNEILLDAWLN